VRILVTGGSGYLGSAAVPVLRARGHTVATIGRHAGDDAMCDLVDAAVTRAAVRSVGDIDAVVHLAARAHNFRGLALNELRLANVTTTGNLVAAIRDASQTATVRFVHASSVAVYELLGRERGLTADEAPYAASKLEAERMVQAEPSLGSCVLRFAPIFDSAHLDDVAKRVFLPGTRLKLRLYPAPMHSLCSIDRAVEAIAHAVEGPSPTGTVVLNVTNPQPTSQQEILGWFPGHSLPAPALVPRAAAGALALCGARGRRLARLLDKFVGPSAYPSPGD
jgi:nucleoside-diphosphate-sugar epimerase